MKEERQVIDKKDVWDLLSRTGVVALAIAVVGFLSYQAMSLGFDGIVLTTAIAAILGLSLAFLGVKLKDVLFK